MSSRNEIKGSQIIQNVAGVNNETSPLTAKGDLLTRTSTANTRLPAGTNGNFLKADSTANEGIVWASASNTFGVRSISSTDTLSASTDDVAILSGASFTLNLPAASGNAGKRFIIKHNGTSLSQVYTIDGNGSETIDGDTTYPLYTNGESVTIVCTGTAWIVVEHHAQTDWVDFPSLTYGTLWTSTGTAGAYGVVATHKAVWRRDGRDMLINYIYRQTATTGSAPGTGALLFNLPSGPTIDTNLVTVNNTVLHSAAAYDSNLGNWMIYQGTTVIGHGVPIAYSSTQLKFHYAAGSSGGTAGAGYFGGSGREDFATTANLALGFNARLPITGWKP